MSEIQQDAARVVNSAVEKVEKPKRPRWRQKRWWLLAAVLVAAWITLVPSRYRPKKVNPPIQTMEPVRNDSGEFQYFATLCRAVEPTLADPEKNGFRDVLAALGPRALEQSALCNRFAGNWAGIRTDENGGKQWWENQWVPLCKAVGVDPNPEPPLIHYIDVEGWISQYGITGEEPIEREANPQEGIEAKRRLDDGELDVFRRRLREKPWRSDDYPIMAKWLEQANPYLDLYIEAVKKPYFYAPHDGDNRNLTDDEREKTPMMVILLPDIQAQRSFARDASVRAMNRVAVGDTVGAADDILAMLRLGRHLQIGPGRCVVERLVGIAIERTGIQSLCAWLTCAEVTKEQLDDFLTQFDALPDSDSLTKSFRVNVDFEILSAFNTLKFILWPSESETKLGFFKRASALNELIALWELEQRGTEYMSAPVLSLPLDANAAFDEMTRITAAGFSGVFDGSLAQSFSRLQEWERRRVAADEGERPVRASCWTAKGRGRRLAQLTSAVFDQFTSLLPNVAAVIRSRAYAEMARLAILLEAFRLDRGDYPQSLDELVPDYLAELPNDPATDEKTFVYRYLPAADGTVWLDADKIVASARNGDANQTDRANDSANAAGEKKPGRYLLYSVGCNKKDDGGSEESSFHIAEDCHLPLDLVFHRWP